MLGPPLPSPTLKKKLEARVKAVEEGGSRFVANNSGI